jgi:hypothetical protein
MVRRPRPPDLVEVRRTACIDDGDVHRRVPNAMAETRGPSDLGRTVGICFLVSLCISRSRVVREELGNIAAGGTLTFRLVGVSSSRVAGG